MSRTRTSNDVIPRSVLSERGTGSYYSSRERGIATGLPPANQICFIYNDDDTLTAVSVFGADYAVYWNYDVLVATLLLLLLIFVLFALAIIRLFCNAKTSPNNMSSAV